MEGECQWFGEDLPGEGTESLGRSLQDVWKDMGSPKGVIPQMDTVTGCQELIVPPFCSYALEAELGKLRKESRPRPRSGSRTKPSIRYRPTSGSTKGCRRPSRDPQ